MTKIYHFIGIKGSGMSALALMLHQMGHKVQGSDVDKYYFTQRGLEQAGIKILPFDAKNIKADYEIIAGNAFRPDNNVEIAYADANGIGYKRYHEFLGGFMRDFVSLGVAGAHGKTSTTGILSHVLSNITDTSYLIGDGTGHGEKNSDFMIAEACEYYRHFLAYHPDYAIVTNIDFDHPDYFNDEYDMFDAFQSFVNQVKNTVVICGDDRLASKLKPAHAKTITYGFNDGNDYQIKNVQTSTEYSKFDIYKNNTLLGTFTMAIFGLHDISNATSAIALADINGISVEKIQESLDLYRPAERRFSEYKFGSNVVVDDYAHHPSEIKATIDSARRKYAGKQIVAIFQPHTYTRTAKFLNEFAESLLTADKVFLCPIFASVREKEKIVGIEDLQKVTPGSEIIHGEEDFDKLNFENTVFLFMGAGNINKLCHKFFEKNTSN